MMHTILIANRGEIACRVIRTARRIGYRTVAVYSEADAGALHVEMADTAVAIGPAPASESYLRAGRILEAAKATSADAVHPGYGFLAENADFAEACAAAGLTFIGPPPGAIRAMGGKSQAKALMADAGVPLVPGYHGDDQAHEILAAAAEEIGYPVLIKASAGGGGKGMRVVDTADSFADQLAGAQREAMSGFGDDRVLIEKYLARPRHVEVQVFADSHGNAVYLFERDCSIQRRHQKVIEEAPAPGMTDDLRRRMGEATVAAAKAIGYVGAGTVEFLLDQDGAFYFMEMNTRLQVEHPVTEMITGLDLVEWQLLVAEGRPLSLGQENLAINGHAIEVRFYAEDPDNDFLPAPGRLRFLAFPEEGGGVRVDTGVRAGDAITPHYDPMIAKLIVHGPDRPTACRRLGHALSQTKVAGPATNLGFLRRIIRHQAFSPGRGDPDLDTGFIERFRGTLLPEPEAAPAEAILLAVLGVTLDRRSSAAGSRTDPWSATDGWRLNGLFDEALSLSDGDRDLAVTVRHGGDQRMVIDGTTYQVTGNLQQSDLTATIDGRRTRATFLRDGLDLTILTETGDFQFTLDDPIARADIDDAATGSLASPMPGKIVTVLVAEGDAVTRGQALLVLEAMKMEHTVKAPADGMIGRLPYRAGDQVDEGVELVGFEIGA
ncbi:MAG: acetyl/propionyl/methylcrotonyl-CoA carboxylase subunit alpha [Pseudomonadota bacterium]